MTATTAMPEAVLIGLAFNLQHRGQLLASVLWACNTLSIERSIAVRRGFRQFYHT